MAAVTTPFFQSTLERLLEKADIVNYASATVMYLGFFVPQNGDNLDPTAMEAEARWAICKVVSDGSSFPYSQRILWASGSHWNNLIWNNRTGFTYAYKNWQ